LQGLPWAMSQVLLVATCVSCSIEDLYFNHETSTGTMDIVLLDAIRADIRENKKLNVHYYESLKRALYKPGAFFKGLVFPLLNVCSCRLSFISARMHFERSGHRCVNTSQNQSPCAPFICSIVAYRRDGLFRWIIFFFSLNDPFTQCRAKLSVYSSAD
jgi:Bystin